MNNVVVIPSAYRDMITGRLTLEAFGLHPHPSSTERRDISLCRTRHSQLILVFGVRAITISLSNPSFKAGA